MKKIVEGFCDSLDIIDVTSLFITMIIIICISVMGMSCIAIRLLWNDLSRCCNTESMITRLLNFVTEAIVSAETSIKTREA